MADGFVNLYQTGWSWERAVRRVSSLVSMGLSLANPHTGKIVTGEWVGGEQVAIGEEDLLRALALTDRDSQSIKYWLDEGTDVYRRMRRVSAEVVVEEFDLDGLGGARYELGQDEVIRMVLEQARGIGPDVVGLVVDRWGTSLEIDLDDIVLGGPTPVTIRPDVLVLRPEVAELHPESADWVRRPCGEFVAFDPTNLLDR